jgi:hypothetical protein
VPNNHFIVLADLSQFQGPGNPGIFLQKTNNPCDPLVRCANIGTAFSMTMGGYKHDQESHSCHQHHGLCDLVRADRFVREENVQAKSG